jgi:Tfp pilus assembly protein PilN
MIQVNLLPGTASKSRNRDFNFSGMIAGAAASVTDKFFVTAVSSAVLSVLAVGFLYMGQSSRERTLIEREQHAVQDSARYKIVLEAKSKAEATRDSLYQQVAIIKSIDDSRYLWPHLLEEISNALPQYTWLTVVTQTSAPPSSAFQDTTKRAAVAADAAKKTTDKDRKAHADEVLAQAARATKFRIVGHTVDIQALTLFMKTLEASPFIQNVQLTRSDLVLSDGKEVTEFQLEAETQKPPAFLVKTVSMSVGDN